MKRIFLTFWREFSKVSLILIILSLCRIASSFLQGNILNNLVNLNFSQFTYSISLLFATFILLLLTTYIQIRYQATTTQKIATKLRTNIMDSVTNVSYSTYHERTGGTYVSWLSNDIQQIEDRAIEPSYDLIAGILSTSISIIALFTIHWSLIVLTLTETILLLQLPKLFHQELGEKSLAVSQENEQFISKVSDYFSGYDTLYAFQRLPYIRKKVHDDSVLLGNTKRHYAKSYGKIAIAGGLGNIISQVSIMALTGYLAYNQHTSIGMIITAGGLGSTIFNTIGTLSQYIATIQSVQPILDKFDALEAQKQERIATSSIEETQNTIFELKDLNFAYDSNKILNQLNFTFEKNKKYAIIGKSGSGKSTLVDILTGKISNYSGSVLFFNHEVNTLSNTDIFNKILYIDQNPHVFNDTIRNNLCLGDTYSDEQLITALKTVDLADLLSTLPNHLDTLIGENGTTLSGGQLQRIALARGILRNQNIIILDESTSKLDSKTALQIEKQLIGNDNLSIIMISHHLDDTIIQSLDGILQL
ncbi:ABC transporter ATP-binding protein [Aerococcaceae bacterium zg-B36]|uniref:ATP-binding cassette domain-containing protein n=1 Tax=Aerococcaceae bacterium zg-252 TaxID=2796928 RepID=UPI001BD8FD20|nr:ABC transporter ATP-binding protein [Aerococcaceae bacterium zg-B36]